MLPASTAQLQPWEQGDQVCPRCGGSGVLRLDGQRSRTCLHCLGQGRLTRLEAATTTAALREAGFSVSVPASSSAAR
jgi:DnaJ-class molecular chaperone